MPRAAVNLVLVASLLVSQGALAARCQGDHVHGHAARPHVHLTTLTATPTHHCHGHKHHHPAVGVEAVEVCEATPTPDHHDADAVYLESAPAVRGERAKATARSAESPLTVALVDAVPSAEPAFRLTSLRLPVLDPPPGPPLYVRHLALLI